MSQVIITLAQFIHILWPLFLATALVYSLQFSPSNRAGRWKIGRAIGNLIKRARRNLLVTWFILLFFWLITLFASRPTPGLLPEPWNTAVFLGGFALLALSEATELGFFKRRLRAHVNLHRAHEIQDLKVMDPTDFEILVSETYRSLGYQVQHIGHSGDHGIDVELRTKGGEFWVVQCKRYSGSVGEGIVRELYGTMVSEKADRAVLVTTARITPPARTWARGKPIDLIDGAAFLFLMDRARLRASNSWFDRLALNLEEFLQPNRPPGLRTAKSNGSVIGPTQEKEPERVVPKVVYFRGVPVCPDCGIPMKIRPIQPREGTGRLLYRCRNYPNCRVVLEAQEVREQPVQSGKADKND